MPDRADAIFYGDQALSSISEKEKARGLFKGTIFKKEGESVIFDNFYVSRVVEVDRASVLQEGMVFFGLDEWEATGSGITCMTRTCLIQIWHLVDYGYFSDGGTTSLYERYLAFASPVADAVIATGTAMTGQWLLFIDCIAGGAVGRASSYRSWVTSHRSIWEVLSSIELTGDDILPYEEGSTISNAGVTMPLDPFLLYESQGIRPLVENISSGGWGVTLDDMRFAISIEEFSSLREIDDSLYDLVIRLAAGCGRWIGRCHNLFFSRIGL